MTASPPAVTTAPPCSVDPDRWFDRTHRTAALEGCLCCRSRRWCAGEALRTNASWGMWAGIWIDGTSEAATRHLAAIAADWPPRPRTAHGELAPKPIPRGPTPLPQSPRIIRCTTAAVVAARSSGHCEIMTAGCQLSADRQLPRIADTDDHAALTASELFFACTSCAQWLSAATESAQAKGYLVASAAEAPNTPFHWRATRWVLLGARGELDEIRPRAARTA